MPKLNNEKKPAAVSVANIEKAKKRRQLLMKSRINLIRDFAAKAREKFGKYVKAVIIFGSFARGDFTLGSDTDVLVLLDDTESDKPIDDNLKQKLHEKLQGLADSVDKNIHVQLHTLSEFWDYIRTGDALFFNYLRTGMPVYDAGFFKPMQRLLLSGAIKPSKEAIFKNIDGAKAYIDKISNYMEWAVERLYRAVTWSANAWLMAAGMPPAEVPELAPVLRKYFVETGQQLDEEQVKTLEEIIQLQKQIEHGEAKGTSPEKVVELKNKADKFVKRMETGVKEFVDGKKRAEELKDRIRTTPKIFWVYKGRDARGYAWLFESNIFMAIYEEKKLKVVLQADIKEGALGTFAETESKRLFESLEKSDFKPIITPNLVTVVLNHLPAGYTGEIEKAGVEYPNKALIDLTSILVKKTGEGSGVGAVVEEKTNKPSLGAEPQV